MGQACGAARPEIGQVVALIGVNLAALALQRRFDPRVTAERKTNPGRQGKDVGAQALVFLVVDLQELYWSIRHRKACSATTDRKSVV